MQKYEHNLAANVSGALRAIAGAEVTVTDNATGLPASLYSDNGTNQLPQPLTTDDTGYFGFYAADGKYTATFSSPRFATFTRQILLEDPDDDPFVTMRSLAAASGASNVGIQPLIANGAGNLQGALEYLEASRRLIPLPQGSVDITTPVVAVQDTNLFPDDCDKIYIDVHDFRADPAVSGATLSLGFYDATGLVRQVPISTPNDGGSTGVLVALEIINGEGTKLFSYETGCKGGSTAGTASSGRAFVSSPGRLKGYRIFYSNANTVQGSIRAYALRRSA
ncbi:carboxypeptidase-like regulatory domain-containing protein [Massilia sp. CFBP9012]|uniref:carboxypeptidase-like regulatory domain-containing protein n=1 Tax=Massilia sp. CFBP9012 TaxID=3096531 RepID=UPI002A6990CC|nr:carboxypeptidase-like regulatory domain-containing protein [Massilia sp. CFBP9012]MDY0974996.1 carboxypeptidase-like regulatory domain-containing protein [Massilia sp. CFBP9012]